MSYLNARVIHNPESGGSDDGMYIGYKMLIVDTQEFMVEEQQVVEYLYKVVVMVTVM